VTRELTPLTEAQRELAGSPKALACARAVARRYAALYPHLEHDILSAAHLGLVHAARRFDPARGLKFGTLAYHRVVGAVRDELRAKLPQGFRRDDRGGCPEVVGLADLPGLPDGGQFEVAECGAGEVGEDLERADAVAALAARLKPRQRHVVVSAFTRCATFETVGRELGITQSGVSQLYKAALAKLREVLA
jgi:RNA polymerase sigma factor (sigma-70 family)